MRFTTLSLLIENINEFFKKRIPNCISEMRKCQNNSIKNCSLTLESNTCNWSIKKQQSGDNDKKFYGKYFQQVTVSMRHSIISKVYEI